jgi:hypothetical protein
MYIMTSTLKYSLQQINDISSNNFTFEIPEDSYNMINYLCTNVGSSILTTNVYQNTIETATINNKNGDTSFKQNKKRKGNKAMEISSEEWESIRTFQATKIEQKTGMDGDIDQIRLFLNKLTDKTFSDIKEKINDKLNKIESETNDVDDLKKVGNILYELCSTNKFYSKIFAVLFVELATNYSWLNDVFNENYKNIMEQYNNIQYIESDANYDGFCEMNKVNEKRKAVTTFLVNLAVNNFITYSEIVKILKDLLTIIVKMIKQPDKKNEVDELTENVAILFNKGLIDTVVDDTDDEEEYYVGEQSIIDTVNGLAKLKAKDYPSLSNKAIFRYMDLVEM